MVHCEPARVFSAARLLEFEKPRVEFQAIEAELRADAAEHREGALAANLNPFKRKQQKPVAYWLDELEKAGVPSGPINDFAQVFADPHVRSRGMEIKVDHPFNHALSLIRNPLTFSATPVTEYRYPPLLGEHTKEILSSKLGYDGEKIAGLKKQGVI